MVTKTKPATKKNAKATGKATGKTAAKLNAKPKANAKPQPPAKNVGGRPPRGSAARECRWSVIVTKDEDAAIARVAERLTGGNKSAAILKAAAMLAALVDGSATLDEIKASLNPAEQPATATKTTTKKS